MSLNPVLWWFPARHWRHCRWPTRRMGKHHQQAAGRMRPNIWVIWSSLPASITIQLWFSVADSTSVCCFCLLVFGGTQYKVPPQLHPQGARSLAPEAHANGEFVDALQQCFCDAAGFVASKIRCPAIKDSADLTVESPKWCWTSFSGSPAGDSWCPWKSTQDTLLLVDLPSGLVGWQFGKKADLGSRMSWV